MTPPGSDSLARGAYMGALAQENGHGHVTSSHHGSAYSHDVPIIHGKLSHYVITHFNECLLFMVSYHTMLLLTLMKEASSL